MSEPVGTGEKTEERGGVTPEMTAQASLALTRASFVSNYVDLVNHTYVNLWAMPYVKAMIKGRDTIEAGFDAFVSTLVRPEFAEEVREFCRVDTVAERLADAGRIDCEYLSTHATGWCRASYYPADWDDDGNLTAVLFTVSKIDEAAANKRNLEAIFDEVPGGIVLYEWRDSRLRVLRMSRYYRELYGASLINETGSPNFERVHPEDLPGYQVACNEALTRTHALNYTYRVWNPLMGRYAWTQIEAIAIPQPDGSSLVYAMYTDVTRQKDAEQALEVKAESERDGYERQIRSLLDQNEDALVTGNANITRDEVTSIQAEGVIARCAEGVRGLDDLLARTALGVQDPEQQARYRALFNREALLAKFRAGESHVALEHYYRVGERHVEWVETAFDLMENPLTGEVVGVCCARSLTEERLSHALLDAVLDRDYLAATLVYVETNEYFRYETDANEYCVHHEGYWEMLERRLEVLCEGEEREAAVRELTRDRVLASLAETGRHDYAFSATYQGERVRLESSIRYVDRRHGLLIATLRNITDSALAERYKHESEHDPLTGLLNRSTLFARCRALLEAHPGERYVMLHCDISHFHLYNTFFGDDAGDDLLCYVAQILGELWSEFDQWAYGRIESDVFAALVPYEPAQFERAVTRFHSEFKAYRDDFPLEASLGAYWVIDPSMSIEAMFSRATSAAKSDARLLYGLVSCYDEAMEASLAETQQITAEMQGAIATEQFQVYLQPKYSLRSERLVGAEALVRWSHPDRGMISPGAFIPVFEKNGFVATLDRYMWEHVCQVLRRWQDEGRPMHPISVNMSRVSLYNRGTVSFLRSLVERYGIDPRYLELELTESAYMDDPEDLRRMLGELQDYGFKILMDDFGSGYSSLNTLRELPVNVLKLDMKFLSESMEDVRAQAVLSSVVRMSKMLHLPIVAEGVENRDQADYLREIGCEYVQGYLFGRPVPVAEYEELLAAADVEEAVVAESGSGPHTPDDVRTIDPLVPMGVVEYRDGQFAYLHANRRFLAEFGLVDNLEPASAVFRMHLGGKGLEVLLAAFDRCSATHGDTVFRVEWEDEGQARSYFGHVHYNGLIGDYADLSAIFVSAADEDVFGF